MRSMTGHGCASADVGGGRVTAEIRAVNHRFVDVRARAPAELAEHVAAAEEVVRRRLARGRVELTLRLEGAAFGAPSLDLERARAALGQLVSLRDALAPGEPVPLTLLSSVPDLFASRACLPADATRAAVVAATEAACDRVCRMRDAEGGATLADLDAHRERIAECLDAVRVRCPEVVTAYAHKLRERIERITADAGVDLDPGRLEHEVALFADRMDVAEEIARLSSHLDQFGELCQGEGPVGRKLEFLLQEIGRETNTIGSKCSDVDLTRTVVDMKAAVERMREQVQNVL